MVTMHDVLEARFGGKRGRYNELKHNRDKYGRFAPKGRPFGAEPRGGKRGAAKAPKTLKGRPAPDGRNTAASNFGAGVGIGAGRAAGGTIGSGIARMTGQDPFYGRVLGAAVGHLAGGNVGVRLGARAGRRLGQKQQSSGAAMGTVLAGYAAGRVGTNALKAHLRKVALSKLSGTPRVTRAQARQNNRFVNEVNAAVNRGKMKGIPGGSAVRRGMRTSKLRQKFADRDRFRVSIKRALKATGLKKRVR